jgi:hypothetical protein
MGEAPAPMTAIWIKALGEGMFPPANAGTVYSIQMWVNGEPLRP